MKKPSATNSAKPPEPPVFFIDRSVASRTVVAALREAGAQLVLQDDLFAQNTPDTAWLAEADRQRWLVLTMDQRIRYNPLEQQALLGSGVGAFIVVAKGLNGAATAACLVAALPALAAFAHQNPRPFIAKVYADGRVVRL